MKTVVKKKNPPRYACSSCKCEIGGGPNPETTVVSPESGQTGVRIFDGEDPIAFDRDCECRCHIPWRIAFGHFTPKLQAQAEVWNARVIEPPEPIEDPW